MSQPKPASEKSPYYDIAEKYGVKIDFRPFIKVESLSAISLTAELGVGAASLLNLDILGVAGGDGDVAGQRNVGASAIGLNHGGLEGVQSNLSRGLYRS